MTPGPWAYELVAVEGPLKGRVWPIQQAVISMGRGHSSQIVLDPDKMCSREHCHILLIGGEIYVEDQNSMNGTWLNGVKVTRRHRLKPGDRIRVGAHGFNIRLPSSGLEIIHESRPVIRPKLSLELRRSLREEFRESPKENSRQFLIKSVAFFAMMLLAGSSVSFSSKQLGTQLQPFSETDPTETPTLSLDFHHSKSVADSQLIRDHYTFMSRRNYDQALLHSLWSLAWNPGNTQLQQAVAEAARALQKMENISQRREAVKTIYEKARLTYLEFKPIQVTLILTQALIDFRLTDGLLYGVAYHQKIARLNELAHFEMQNQVIPKISEIESDLNQGNLLEAKLALTDLLKKFPYHRDLQNLHSRILVLQFEHDRALAAESRTP